MTLPCPTCRTPIDAPSDHGVLVECACGALLVVRADVAGHHLRERVVDAGTIDLALSHLRSVK